MDKEKPSTLRELLVNNEFQKLFEELKLLYPKSKWSEVDSIEGQFKSLQGKVQKGIISYEKITIEENKIREKLAKLIDSIEKPEAENELIEGAAILEPPKISLTPKKKSIRIFAFSLCAIVVFFILNLRVKTAPFSFKGSVDFVKFKLEKDCDIEKMNLNLFEFFNPEKGCKVDDFNALSVETNELRLEKNIVFDHLRIRKDNLMTLLIKETDIVLGVGQYSTKISFQLFNTVIKSDDSTRTVGRLFSPSIVQCEIPIPSQLTFQVCDTCIHTLILKDILINSISFQRENISSLHVGEMSFLGKEMILEEGDLFELDKIKEASLTLAVDLSEKSGKINLEINGVTSGVIIGKRRFYPKLFEKILFKLGMLG